MLFFLFCFARPLNLNKKMIFFTVVLCSSYNMYKHVFVND